LSSKTLTKPLHSYRQMGPAHWDALFNLDANGVVYVVPDESKGAAAAVTVDGAATPLLSAKQRRQQSKKKKNKTPEGEDTSSSAGTTPTPPPTPSSSSSFYWGTAMSSTDVVAAVTSRTKVRWHLKRGVVACRDLFVAYMVLWSAMLFANAGWGWKCQNTFEWFSPTVGKWANKTCKSDLQWTFQMSQGWKMFDRGIDTYDQWITMPAQLADGRMGIDIAEAWPMLPDPKTRLSQVPAYDGTFYSFGVRSPPCRTMQG